MLTHKAMHVYSRSSPRATKTVNEHILPILQTERKSMMRNKELR